MTDVHILGRDRTASADETSPAELTAEGYLRLPGEFSLGHFTADRCVGIVKDGDYILLPASVHAPNGLIMKQRNLAGDRSVLIREVWGDDHPVGAVIATWQAARRRLVIPAVQHTAAQPEMPTAGQTATRQTTTGETA